MNCYICENKMDLVRSKTISILGHVLVYECKICREIVYTPIRKEDDNERN